MSLFQKSVIKKYQNELDAKTIDEKYAAFQDYFGKPDIQEHIRNVNEEQFQVHFFRKLFVDILGYTLNDQPNYNLDVEFKNINDSGKADGAILANDKAIGVVELKSTQTTDLDSIESQAFGYKIHHPGCDYIITSNFEKLRFYIQNAVDSIEFDLFNLSREQFSLMWLCLAKENLLQQIPRQMKDASVLQEEDVTKKLYADYSTFREALFNNMVKNNPQIDNLILFKKTQKLLDRFLFIFFAEDRLLVPPNSITKIIEKWQDDVDFGDDKSLYDLFKQYFNILNEGRPKSGKRQEIYAYNGGLFQPDKILDKIIIDDDVLKEHTLKLSAYDFETDVDVNILGHIFEHSIGEIENIQAEIQGETFDKNKSRRKKEGVYYTPKYITKYIVENTVGKLCDEKKKELGIVDEVYTRGRKNRKKTKIKELNDKLDDYRNWLLQLNILDPACGSGAFLNQALDFLIQEHSKIDELRANLLGESMQLSDITNDILEKNIYGVDINEESVEIAKLSLWLRTAKKGRKLNTLSQNIKCGNSLIEDPKVAGEKAFKWEEQFPEVFNKGGFDVVIGNPPYGANLIGKNWLKVRYPKTSYGVIDSYKYFVELAIKLNKTQGAFSYIMPDSYLEKEYYSDVREILATNYSIISNIKLGDDIFEEVNLPTAITLSINKGKQLAFYSYLDLSRKEKSDKPHDLLTSKFKSEYPDFKESFVLSTNLIKSKNTIKLSDAYDQVMGVKVYQKGKGTPEQTGIEKEEDKFISKKNNSKYSMPYISHGIQRYYYNEQNEYINYGIHLAEPRKEIYFTKPKIVAREIINPRIFATYIEKPAVVKNIAAVIIQKYENYPLKYLLGILNSKLITYYSFEQSPKSGNKSYPSFTSKLIKSIPVAVPSEKSKEYLIYLTDSINEQINSFYIKINSFAEYLTAKFNLKNTPKKITQWHALDKTDFLEELKNKNIKLSRQEESEWMRYFKEQKERLMEIQEEINQTDREIDQLVYELYGLTDEEIKIVEESVS